MMQIKTMFITLFVIFSVFETDLVTGHRQGSNTNYRRPDSATTTVNILPPGTNKPCGGSFEATNGWQNLNSPNHPNHYGNNEQCLYTINAPGNNFIITMKFAYCDLEANYDFIKIENIAGETVFRSSICYDHHYELHINGKALVTFTTDSSVTRTGFMIAYKLSTTRHEEDRRPTNGPVPTPWRLFTQTISYATPQPTIPCNRTLTATDDWKNFTSPNHPKAYGNNLNCTYIINAPRNKYIIVNITFCQLEANFDFLNISSGASDLLQSISDNNLPVPYHLTTYVNQSVIRFKTDGSVTNRGFVIKYKYTSTRPRDEPSTTTRQITTGRVTTSTILFAPTTPSIPCNKTLVATENWQNQSSPNYPDVYTNSLNCTYKINAPVNKLILVNITDCQLELNFDFLNISSGGEQMFNTSSSNLLTPYSFITKINQAIIRFTTDGSVTNKGFNIQYKLTKKHNG